MPVIVPIIIYIYINVNSFRDFICSNAKINRIVRNRKKTGGFSFGISENKIIQNCTVLFFDETMATQRIFI